MTTGVIIIGVSLAVMILNIILGFFLFSERDGIHPVTIVLHLLCAIGYITGIIVLLYNFVEWLSAH